MGKRKRKFTSGEATQFISKRAAERNLQISDREFQRLRVLIGTHPVEPKHKKRVGKGSTFPREYFFKKDVQHIGRNPIISLLRKKRVFFKKLRKAREKNENDAFERLQANMPDETYYIDNIIYERYPTPTDALNDIDDCLNFIFMFSRLPGISGVSAETIDLCRTLAIEFLNYVIVTRSLRKVFASIKGFYFQAEIHNTSVIWMMPHDLVHKAPTNIEFGLFKFYCDLYTRVLEFVLIWLYKDKNMFYPPQLVKTTDLGADKTLELIASLNQPLSCKSKSSQESAGGMLEGGDFAAAEEKMLKDHLEMQRVGAGPSDDVQSRAAEERLRNLAKTRLFSGTKLFLGRETPRQILCVIIRSCGGLVSWPETCGLGATFTHDDPEIKYEVIDRPMKPESMRLDRKYVQPQWVFDCLNAGQILPVGKYAPGVTPPSHVSPFVASDNLSDDEEESEDEIEEEEVEDVEAEEDTVEEGADGESENEMEEEDDDDDEEEEEESDEDVGTAAGKPEEAKKGKANIVRGRIPSEKEISNAREKKANEQRRLREAMLPKKHRELYKKMCYSIKRSQKDKEKLKQKRLKAKKK